MHNNYYFLRQLSARLASLLTGLRVETCFSQHRDELIIGFAGADRELYLRAYLTQQFSALSVTDSFQRARRNSIDLFEPLIGATVTGLVQHRNERSFYLELGTGQQLLFKLFGNRSNVVLVEHDQPLRIFNNQLKNDWDLRLSQLSRDLDFSRAHFLQSELPLRQLYPTLGDLVLHYLTEKGFEQAPKEAQWELLHQTLQELEQPAAYRVVEFRKQVRLSLLPVGHTLAALADPVEALNQFVQLYLSRQGFQTLYQQWQQRLRKALQQDLEFIRKNEAQLRELKQGKNYAHLADVLMANLHQIPTRAAEVKLFNFYTEQETSFRFKTGETPQRLAERYYRKAKLQPLQISRLQQTLSARELEALQLEEHLQQLEQITDYRALKRFTQELESTAPAAVKAKAAVPFKVYHCLGFTIWVGRSARNNDLLTQRYAHKEDLWLHAKDVAGSHVVIRHQAGKPFPQPLLEKAAQLAAWHSKRKTDSLCPVTYTPKKFVRKRKGAADGEVVVDREKVLLVPPLDFPELLAE